MLPDRLVESLDSRLSTGAPLRIESIADHLDLVDTIAAWHWREWGRTDPGGSQSTWADRLRRCTNREGIPTIYVALLDGEPAGSVTLNEHDMSTHRDLSPWLSGLHVHLPGRGKGVAAAMIRHAMSSAPDWGVSHLYLYTSSARGLYEKLGWSVVGEDYYDDRTVVILCADLMRGLRDGGVGGTPLGASPTDVSASATACVGQPAQGEV
jgi:GNAT superfamily N-acetyltransferase